MIDKVVRMRGLHGRFGIDHSELLNYEIDQTNKNRDEHMNWLVYMSEQQAEKMSAQEQSLSKVLKDKLNIQPEELEMVTMDSERKNNANLAAQNKKVTIEEPNDSDGNQQTLTYKEWLKHKDAEKRLKRKLITQAQDELRTQLLQMANHE